MSYEIVVNPSRSYTIEYANQRGPQGPAGADGDDATATTDASLLVSGTLSDARLSSNVALENAANVFSAKQSFSGTDHVGLCLQSLTTAEYNALTPANGDLFRDSTTDRIDARLARGTVELIDSAGGQTINGALGVTGNITLATGVVITSGAAGVGVLTINNDGNSRWVYNGAEFIVAGAIRPSTTNARTLGTSGQRWSTVFGVAGDFSGNLTASGTVNTLQIDSGISASRLRLMRGSAQGVDIQANEPTNPLFRVSYSGIEFPLSVTRSDVAVTGNLTASGTVTIGTYTVGTLPSAAANTRARAFVTDSNLAFNSTNLGSTVTAGGAILVPVFSDGTNWVIG